MKKAISFVLTAVFLCGVCGSACTEDGERAGSSEGTEAGETVRRDAPRYDRMMRDLDREYQAGGLTEVEYVQRKQQIEDLDR